MRKRKTAASMQPCNPKVCGGTKLKLPDELRALLLVLGLKRNFLPDHASDANHDLGLDPPA